MLEHACCVAPPALGYPKRDTRAAGRRINEMSGTSKKPWTRSGYPPLPNPRPGCLLGDEPMALEVINGAAEQDSFR